MSSNDRKWGSVQKAAVFGAAVSALGCFIPAFTAPFVGDITYFMGGKGDGLIVVVACFIALWLASASATKWVVVFGGVAMALSLNAMAGMSDVILDNALFSFGPGLPVVFVGGLVQFFAGFCDFDWAK